MPWAWDWGKDAAYTWLLDIKNSYSISHTTAEKESVVRSHYLQVCVCVCACGTHLITYVHFKFFCVQA